MPVKSFSFNEPEKGIVTQLPSNRVARSLPSATTVLAGIRPRVTEIILANGPPRARGPSRSAFRMAAF